MSVYSPLRYPGGKGKLASYVIDVVKLNKLENLDYVEPYAGGAGVALELLLTETVKKIHINDLDRSIYAFWHSVLHETNRLCERIQDTPITIDEWKKQREIRKEYQEADLMDLGFSTLFLNRTNRSGVLNGGPIGGIEQSGTWQLDCRFNREELIRRIQRIAAYRSRIVLTCLDAAELLTFNLQDVKEGSLVYLDPPYYVKGAYLYRNHYKHADHEQLSKIVGSLGNYRWLVSYDNVPEIKELYADFCQTEFDIIYSANGYSMAKEVLISDNELNIPEFVYTSQKQRIALRQNA